MLHGEPRRKDGRCPGCGQPRAGSTGYCRPCGNAYMREWRRTHPPTEEQRRRGVARAYANVYLRRGKLQRQPCRCGATRVQAHHRDYTKPLEVEWLCRRCHREEHRRAG